MTLFHSTGVTIKDHLISSNDICEQLINTLDILESEANDILNSQDKQNVPKAVNLLWYLNRLQGVQPPTNKFHHLHMIMLQPY